MAVGKDYQEKSSDYTGSRIPALGSCEHLYQWDKMKVWYYGCQILTVI